MYKIYQINFVNLRLLSEKDQHMACNATVVFIPVKQFTFELYPFQRSVNKVMFSWSSSKLLDSIINRSTIIGVWNDCKVNMSI